MTPEGKVKLWLQNQLDKRYGHLHVWSYAPPGGYFGQNGTMDRILSIESGTLEDRPLYEKYGPPPGVLVGIEVKAEGNELRPLQRRKLEELYRAGGVAAVLIGKDFAKMNQIFEEIDKRRAMARFAWKEWIRDHEPARIEMVKAMMVGNDILKELPFKAVEPGAPMIYKRDGNAF